MQNRRHVAGTCSQNQGRVPFPDLPPPHKKDEKNFLNNSPPFFPSSLASHSSNAGSVALRSGFTGPFIRNDLELFGVEPGVTDGVTFRLSLEKPVLELELLRERLKRSLAEVLLAGRVAEERDLP